jgi:hypothetical protein
MWLIVLRTTVDLSDFIGVPEVSGMTWRREYHSSLHDCRGECQFATVGGVGVVQVSRI